MDYFETSSNYEQNVREPIYVRPNQRANFQNKSNRVKITQLDLDYLSTEPKSHFKSNRRVWKNPPNPSLIIAKNPSQNPINTELNFNQDLPFARLHNNSFRKLFPNMYLKEARKRKAFLRAAKQMPFYKYSNHQLGHIFQTKNYSAKHEKQHLPSSNSYFPIDNVSCNANPNENMVTLGKFDFENIIEDKDLFICKFKEFEHPEFQEFNIPINKNNLSNNNEDKVDKRDNYELTDNKRKFDYEYLSHTNDEEKPTIEIVREQSDLDSKLVPHETLLKSISVPGGLLCNSCGQIAYPAERFEFGDHVFHTACFRCKGCNRTLHRGSWNQYGSHYYCNPCHRQQTLQTLRN